MASESQQTKIVRTLRLTPEGWIFLVILAFVSFGSVLRNVNLLIALSGMMFSGIVLNWRSAVHRLRSIDATRKMPDRIFAHRLTSIVWHCSNHHPTHVAFSVNVDDRMDLLDAAGQPAPEAKLGLIARIRQHISDSVNRFRRVGPNEVRLNLRALLPNSTQSSVFQTWFERRGAYQTGVGEISSTFPFGLIEIKIQLNQTTTFYVAPALGKLSPTWDKRANAMLTGNDASKRKRGNEDDQFFALRKWRSGDERKHIDWRSTARMGSPMVKQFDQPSDRDVAIVVDLFQDDSVNDEEIETILSFATTAAVKLGANLHGRMTISLCGKQCETFRHLATAESTLSFLKAASTAMSDTDPDIYSGIKNAGASVSSGTPIFVVSARPEPVWVRQLATVDSSTNDKQDNDIFRSLAYPDVALGQLTDMIQWIDMRSAVFQSLFSLNISRDRSQLEELSRKHSVSDGTHEKTSTRN